ncbi:MAG: HEAT repeat domain-containing protein [Candidatus Tectimicrobiota bacterium]
MGLWDAYKIKKALAVLLASHDAANPGTAQALIRLKEIGRPALSKFIEALGSAKNPELLEDLLVSLLDNETLPLFVNHLTHANPQIATSVARVFIKGHKYDPNRLLSLLSDARAPKAALGKILSQRKDHLNLKALMTLLGTVERDSRGMVLRLIERGATEAMLPDLIRAARSDDAATRISMVRTLAHFSTEAVRETLVGLLSDTHKDVRQAALEGLASLKLPVDVAPICQLLRDPEPAMQLKARELLAHFHDPLTARHLVDLLQDDAEEVRHRAVEVLNSLRETGTMRVLFEALRDKEWWAQVRVFEALRTGGNAKLFEAVLALLRDEDTYMRNSAMEVLKKDQRAFKHLVEMLGDSNPEVKARTVEALVTLEDKRAVPIFLRMLQETPAFGTLVIPALAKLGDRQAIPPLLECLNGTQAALRKESLRALAVLTDAAHAEQVLKAVMAVRDTADPELKEAANGTATALISKFGAAAVGGSIQAISPSMAISQHQSLLHEQRQAGLSGILSGETHELPVIVSEDHGPERYIDADTLEPDDLLVGRYRVIQRVGKGGFGAVVLVEDTVVGEEIILKFLNREVASDEGMIKRFIHELRYARRITHENVIRIHDFLMLGKSYAISMEYFPSQSLTDEMKHGPLSVKRGLKIIWDICRGMSAAHQAGVVHRDLKPPNILINEQGLVKVVDFGLAAVNHADSRLTRTGVLLGTPTYMAPEQVRARTIDARTDIYSLGVIMYEIFTGRAPYIADDPMAILFQHVEGNPTPPRQLKADLPPGLEAIILKAMWVDPAKRFQTMDDLRRSIVALSKQEAR